ncbi:uncharacterized protein BCR38DRAFT_480167 [Pseudomassariella vexata]|uniref:Zn(2)-C6 fungal-type domain-containing protein n=1 Tax=Pseudomassariella vexata TaxID=1141098 RepID=A0A1Y2EJD8_9PEZI|nr:uncharacterized protein BCR38DRAFT_480167 [Pseudomassariella vexata]ORY71672.1 hypothetical protein BCR38DRAFT_480167 [Pseudomassariella vexata]
MSEGIHNLTEAIALLTPARHQRQSAMEDPTSSRPRGPRLYHKKSRTGCVRCKQRRVKCSEERPSCAGCSRHMVECVYPYQAAASSASPPGLPHVSSSIRAKSKGAVVSATTDFGASRHGGTGLSPSNTENGNRAHTPGSFGHTPGSQGTQSSPGSSHRTPIEGPSEADLDIPESKERRMWELRLLHNGLLMANPFSSTQAGPMTHLWNVDIPNMALRDGSDLILYGLLAHSALNMLTKPSTTAKEREELEVLHQTYLALLLREQRRDVAKMSPANADVICFSSLRILTHAMAMVQTVPMDPWEPPLDWLQMGRGAGVVFLTAKEAVLSGEGNKFGTFLRAPGVVEDPNETIYGDHSELDWLLEHPAGAHSAEAQADVELDDAETLRIYNSALSYICCSRRAIERGETDYAIARRLGGFSVWMPNDYTQYLVERRSRAMVILAHFMALWIDFEDAWIIGKAGERQIRGIQKSLPLAWSSKLDGLFSKFRTPGNRPEASREAP